MALLLRRGAAIAARSFRAAAAASASTTVHRLPAGGSLAGAGEFAPARLFVFESRRGFAKGKKSKDDRGDTVQVVPDIGQNTSKEEIEYAKIAAFGHMHFAKMTLRRELSKLRTARAIFDMLAHIVVENAGAKVALGNLANVSILDAHTVSVGPYDPTPTSMKSIEHAIITAPFGINPTPDGNRIIVAIPPLTKENMQALCKVVTESAEDFKQSIRRARQKALGKIKKIKKSASSMPKDDVEWIEKEVKKIEKEFEEVMKEADDMCKAKEKEISGGIDCCPPMNIYYIISWDQVEKLWKKADDMCKAKEKEISGGMDEEVHEESR